jgi:hypothetical protein
MPRPALAKVSTAALQTELARRAAQLGKLLKTRDHIDAEIAELQSHTGAVTAAPVVKVGRKRGRPAKVAMVVAAPVAKKRGNRGSYDLTAGDFIITLLAGGKTLTTAQLKAAWTNGGRGGKVDNALTQLVKTGLVKRVKVGLGSEYSLAGAARKAPDKPGVKQAAAAKLPTKRGKFVLTAGEFILGLLKKKALTGRQVNEAWKKAGRGAVADSDLSNLVKAGKIKREKLGGKLGSEYSLAGTVTKAAAKPIAKKGKKTFACRTCKKVFASGPMLGVHYKAKPSHRQK